MKTLYISRGSNIIIDTENNTANRTEACRQGIDNLFLAEEPMHVVYGYGEFQKECDVEKGDIIVTFYNDSFKNRMIIVKNEEWVENLVEAKKAEQEEKERWAAIQG